MPKVLIIDDDQTLRQAYRVALEALGVEVTEVEEGQQGLEAIEKSAPDLILLDMLMPVMGGMDFMTRYSKTKHPAKVIALTNSQVPHDTEKRMREMGALEYLQKSRLSPKEVADMALKYCQGTDRTD